jgi:hypothetical protein
MSEMPLTTGDLLADAQVILLLHARDDAGLLRFIDAQYGVKFVMEQTGASFEDCIDWCAQNAGGVDNAKRVLLLLFERYYLRLPTRVQADLRYLAEEVGYDPRQTLEGLRALCRPQIKRGATRALSFVRAARMVLSMRLLRFSVTLAPKMGA